MGLIQRAGICLLIGVSVCGRAAAQTKFDAPPAGALAWWAVDPRVEPTAAERAQRQLIDATLDTVLSSGMVGDTDAINVISGMLIASTVGATAHQFTLLELEGAPEGERIKRFKGVLEIRGPVDHATLVGILQTVLVDAIDEQGQQRTMELPGRREGVAFRRADWPDWLEVSWTSGDGVFYVGIGVDALSTWLDAQIGAPKASWDAHISSVDARGGDRMLTLFLDLDALRRAAPAWFGYGAFGGDMLTAWSLPNARLFMVHAQLLDAAQVPSTGADYEGPPLLVIDATWEARSDPLGTIRRREVTEAQWPGADLAMAPPPGRFVIVAPTRSLQWIQRGIGMRLALSDNQREVFAASRRWAGRTQARIRRLERAAAPFVILGDSSAMRLPLLGTAHLEFDRRVALESVEREIRFLAQTLGDIVVFDEDNRIWSVPLLPRTLDPSGSLSLIAWGMAQGERPVLVIGWSVESVEAARRRLAP